MVDAVLADEDLLVRFFLFELDQGYERLLVPWQAKWLRERKSAWKLAVVKEPIHQMKRYTKSTSMIVLISKMIMYSCIACAELQKVAIPRESVTPVFRKSVLRPVIANQPVWWLGTLLIHLPIYQKTEQEILIDEKVIILSEDKGVNPYDYIYESLKGMKSLGRVPCPPWIFY